ncbi:MAG: putative PEP-binding protein [Candidatus Helarchaeota archaeon]
MEFIEQNKFIHYFSDHNNISEDLLGEKGLNLCELSKLGVPVPVGFIISSKACLEYLNNPNFMKTLKENIKEGIRFLENETGLKFGDGHKPLLVSVRCSSKVAMPGMMGSILNIGINEEIAEKMSKTLKNKIAAYEIYRKLILLYADIVMGLDREIFENIFNEYIEKKKGASEENNNKKNKEGNKKISKEHNSSEKYNKEQLKKAKSNLTIQDYRNIINEYKRFYKEIIGENFSEDPYEQLYSSIKALFELYDSPKIKNFRKANKIPQVGIALIVQKMVFGNIDESSMTGRAVSRDPVTGTNKITGEYCINAQGDEIFFGKKRCFEIKRLKKVNSNIYNLLKNYLKKTEQYFKDMQQFEFTVESGNLYILQTRAANRSAVAHVKVIMDMLHEKIYNEKEAILRIDTKKLQQLLFKQIDPSIKHNTITRGLDASPGAVSGHVVFSAEDVEEWVRNGKKVLLLKDELKSDDIHALTLAEGLITVHGGKTSFGAIVARSIGKPAVCGANKIKIDIGNKIFKVGNRKFYEGDLITIDGGTGLIIKGQGILVENDLKKEVFELLELADQHKDLKIKINADTAELATKSLHYGIDGVGLCRIEHIFLSSIAKKIIMARSSEERLKALGELKPILKDLFKQIFIAMEGKPVAIRLLDMPLYELIPDIQELKTEISILKYKLKNGFPVKRLLKEKEMLYSYYDDILERNPLLGLRGCRLHFKWPEIDYIVCEAIFESTIETIMDGYAVKPEIVIPLVSYVEELKIIKNDINQIAQKIKEEKNFDFEYKLGVLIEVPRCALIADKLAPHVDFFSFGTNDLTSMVLGISRIDGEEKFLNKYIKKDIININPFETIDEIGPGFLIKYAIEKGKKANPNIEINIVGEHAGNPNSIKFFHKLNVDYVSCAPLQVPIIKIAAAQAKLKNND